MLRQTVLCHVWDEIFVKNRVFSLDTLFYSHLKRIISMNNYELARLKANPRRQYEMSTSVLVHIYIVVPERDSFVDWQTDNSWTNLGQAGQILSDEEQRGGQ